MGARALKTLAWGFGMAPHRLRALVCLSVLSVDTTTKTFSFICYSDFIHQIGIVPVPLKLGILLMPKA